MMPSGHLLGCAKAHIVVGYSAPEVGFQRTLLANEIRSIDNILRHPTRLCIEGHADIATLQHNLAWCALQFILDALSIGQR